VGKIKTDVAVIGAGPAGISAAVAASREGAKTLLIEKNGFLGGTPISGRPGAFCGFYTSDSSPKQIIKGIAGEMLQILKRSNSVYGPFNFSGMVVLFYDLPMLKMTFDEMVSDSAVDVLLHSQLISSNRNGRQISSVVVAGKSGLMEVHSKLFVDATGDADLAYMSGANCVKSTELQPGSTMYRIGNVNVDKAMAYMKTGELHRAIQEANSKGDFSISRHDGLILPTPRPKEVVIGFSHIPVDGTDIRSLTKAEIEAHKEISQSFNFLKARVPGFENAYILDIGLSIGIRETRRLVGEYVLTEGDVLSARKFDDGICCCAWPIELHTKESTELKFLKLGEWYNVPLRSTLAIELDNLLVAGRSISCTKMAQASCRVIAPAMAVGQACGLAASISINQGMSLKAFDVKGFQSRLRRQGAYL